MFLAFFTNVLISFKAMFKKVLVLVLLTSSTLVQAVYSPQSGEDWTQLKPDTPALDESHDSVPFAFGIVVNPYVINHDGDYEKPPYSSIPRTLTTTFVTSVETEAPKATKTNDVVYQIPDGQIQRTTVVTDEYDEEDTLDEELQEEIKAKREVEEDSCDEDDDENESFVSPVYAVSCKTNTTLEMSLEGGILKDSNNRIGCIVGSRQFQFDGPLPQHGAIYAAGWSITNKAQLALGNSTLFYQCSSGEFYNLYDQPIAYQCSPVSLDVVELIDC